jgi:hypothetical protein
MKGLLLIYSISSLLFGVASDVHMFTLSARCNLEGCEEQLPLINIEVRVSNLV